ncbi:hypothetical protein A500_07641 [Clostridium sartagoforme AAU1]|jgi:uncharacterized protein YkwD|uniref:SCP domain-containing protein n=1 Tax=Clostridium sartagoforme AAU1 TaxID=1202534 RepID=R9CH83_9CLOT|nr:CAP domain-containing protein [Clostridium sartagoforme]EOR26566.1 hypothetical protein A500_07641 [Clostridium sartagoforme AAU1]
MSKSRIITLIISGFLAIAVAGGVYYTYSKNEVGDNNTTNIEENKKLASDKNKNDNDKNKETEIPDNSDGGPNINEENNDGSPDLGGNVPNNNDNSNNETVPPSQPEQAPQAPQGGSVNPNTITPEVPQQPSTSDNSNYIAEIEQAIFQRVNKERAAAGLTALSYNTTMEYYARIKSKDMGDKGYFDHKDPQGRLITEQMKADGVSYNAWGENIAYIQGARGDSALATQFMDNWMNSPGHRANILSSNFSSIGIGVFKIGDTYYATQEFYR